MIASAPDLDLEDIPEELHDVAGWYCADGDAEGLLCLADNCHGLHIVLNNIEALLARGIYEPALLHAYTETRPNNYYWPISVLDILFGRADRDKLRAAGDKLPPGEHFTLYRGVAGRGNHRRVRSFSWTLDLPRACWFASRLRLPDPAVYQATVSRDDVLVFYNGRDEQEIICRPRRCTRLELCRVGIHAHQKEIGWRALLKRHAESKIAG